jgi:hypothetical protein
LTNFGGSSDLPGQLGKWASYANVANIIYESAQDKFDSADEEAKSKGITTGELFRQKFQEKENNKKPLFDVDLFSMVKSWWSSPATIGKTHLQQQACRLICCLSSNKNHNPLTSPQS